MTKRLYRSDGQYLGGSRAPTRCAKGHRLTKSNLVKVGSGNGFRCRKCRKAINDASRARQKAKGQADG